MSGLLLSVVVLFAKYPHASRPVSFVPEEKECRCVSSPRVAQYFRPVGNWVAYLSVVSVGLPGSPVVPVRVHHSHCFRGASQVIAGKSYFLFVRGTADFHTHCFSSFTYFRELLVKIKM